MGENREATLPAWDDIEHILKIGGTAGASIGIVHHGKILARRSFGYQDVESKSATTSTTLYPLGSLSKLFVSTTCAQLVQEGILDWHANVSQYLPDYRPKSSPHLVDSLRLVDLLSHSAGFARKDALWLGSNNTVLVDKEHLISVCNDLKPIAQPRTKWIYNNFMYALVGAIIERTTGKPWGTALETRVLKKIGLESTSVREAEVDSNRVARPYLVSDEGKLYRLGDVGMFDNDALSAAGGVRSNVDDMMKFALAILQNIDGSSSDLTNMDVVLSGHSILKSHLKYDELYALGLGKVTTPATFGRMGFNINLVKNMPVLGEKSHSKLVFYHNGAIPGYNHCLMIVPETQTVIVALTNSMSRGDTADWIAQALLKDILHLKPDLSMMPLVEEAAQQWTGRYSAMQEKLESQRVPNTKSPRHEEIIGTYVHSTGALSLVVSADGEDLQFQINGLESQIHQLRHYQYDTFTFFPSAEERNKRGMVQYSANAFLIEFRRDSEEKFVDIKWVLDNDVPEGEILTKTA